MMLVTAVATLNRTMVELKFAFPDCGGNAERPLNRTMVELKFHFPEMKP